MPAAYKILGQVQVAAGNAESLLYQVPVGGSAIISTLTCLGASGGTTLRIRIQPAGASLLGRQYLIYDYPVGSLEPRFFTLGITLAAGDSIYVASAGANSSFQAFGQEFS